MESHRNTFLDINLENLEYNYDFYKSQTNKAIFSVVKANAYGLGAVAIAKYLINLNSEYLGVASLDEALELRNNGIKAPILVMGYTAITSVKVAAKNNISLTVVSLQWAQSLAKLDTNNLTLHVKVNSSMNRLGHNNLEEVIETIKLLKNKHNIEGIFTHYCCKDSNIVNNDFNKFQAIVINCNYKFKWIHAANSFNALMFKEEFTNAVRIGIGLYGGLLELGLKNVATLKTEVSLIRNLDVAETVSYDGLFKATSKTKVAILSIGYADGILRSDRGSQVFINGNYYQIIGSICMDQMMVEVDDKVKLYAEVEIFGDHISLMDIAKRRNTIDYEILTAISSRVVRRYI